MGNYVGNNNTIYRFVGRFNLSWQNTDLPTTLYTWIDMAAMMFFVSEKHVRNSAGANAAARAIIMETFVLTKDKGFF